MVAGSATRLEWMLRRITKVHAGEGLRALLLLSCVFLILTSYYLMKTAREALILTGGTFGLRGAELKSYSGGAMAVLLVALVPAYDALANRVRRIRLINVSYAIVIGCLVALYAVARSGVPIGLAFFVWLGIVNMFLIAQFWSYANDLYTEEQGNRLFALIGIGASLGAVVGPALASFVTTYTLLPFAAVLLIGCVAVFNVVEHIGDRDDPARQRANAPIDGKPAVTLIVRHRYLLLIAGLVLVSELVKTNGEFILSSAAISHAEHLVPATAHADLAGAARAAAITADRQDVIKAFYGQFFLWVNVVSLLVQAFVVSRIIEKFGVGRALFVMPVIAFGAYGAIAVLTSIALVGVAKATENAANYSIQNTVRQTLFLPTDRAMKYKAKAAIDTFVVRAADAVSALFVWLSVRELPNTIRGLAVLNIGLVALWIGVAWRLARRHRALSRVAAGAPAR